MKKVKDFLNVRKYKRKFRTMQNKYETELINNSELKEKLIAEYEKDFQYDEIIKRLSEENKNLKTVNRKLEREIKPRKKIVKIKND